MILRKNKSIVMKVGSGIIWAGGIALAVGLGFFGIRRLLMEKHAKYQDCYTDFHRNFVKHSRYEQNDDHGVELFAMQ